MEKEIIDKIIFDNFLKSVPTMVVDTKGVQVTYWKVKRGNDEQR